MGLQGHAPAAQAGAIPLHDRDGGRPEPALQSRDQKFLFGGRGFYACKHAIVDHTNTPPREPPLSLFPKLDVLVFVELLLLKLFFCGLDLKFLLLLLCI